MPIHSASDGTSPNCHQANSRATAGIARVFRPAAPAANRDNRCNQTSQPRPAARQPLNSRIAQNAGCQSTAGCGQKSDKPYSGNRPNSSCQKVRPRVSTWCFCRNRLAMMADRAQQKPAASASRSPRQLGQACHGVSTQTRPANAKSTAHHCKGRRCSPRNRRANNRVQNGIV